MGLKKAEEGAGLAFLVNSDSKGSSNSAPGQPWQLSALIGYVLDLDAKDHEAASTTSTSTRFEDVEPLLEAHCRRVCEQQADSASAQPSTSQPSTSEEGQEASGRLGPPVVRIDDASVAGHFHQRAEGGLELESLENFSSCRANVCVYKGKWFYEATVLTSGIQQIGWATLQCPFTAEEGVGDAPDSYAIDGKRVRKWNVKPQPYGEAWAQGDVIGCAIDLDAGTLSFSRNGASLGIAYENVRTMQPSLAYFPALSLSHAERCALNFGARPFAHPSPPGYAPLQAPPPSSDSAQAAYLCASLGRLVRAAAGVGTGPDTGSGGAAGPAKPEDSFLPRAPLAWADAVLLGGAIVARLQPLLATRPYLVHSELLPLLMALHRVREPHRPALVAAAVRVLELVMEREAFGAAMERVLEQLSNNCRTAQLIPEQAPFTAAYPHLALARALLQSRAVRSLWLHHPDFMALTEGFLTRKSPGQGDLKGLLPHVWWEGCREEGASQEKLEESVSMLRATIARVEDAQFSLISILMTEPDPLDASSSAFLAFLRHLLHKNRSSLRDVPPPGLSDHTVIWGTFWVLLRVLQPALAAAGQGARSSLTAFPVADMFASTSSDAEFLPTYDMPRLGGIITHMTRETPLTPADRAPVAVAAPAVLQTPAYQDTTPPPSIPDAALPELLNGAMLLYCWRVGMSLRMLTSLSAALASSRASLEEMERLAEVPSAGSQAWLQDARAYYRDEVIRDVRLLTLLKVAFFSSYKQQALAALGAYLSALVQAAGPPGSNLLAYVPTVYVECPVEYLHVLRRTDGGGDLQPQAPGTQAFVSLLASTLADARILNPDVKESLLQCTSLVLDSPQWAAAFESNEHVRTRLVPAVLTVFDSKLWHPASNVLLRLIKDSGFGLVKSREGGLPALQQLLRDEMRRGQEGAAFKGFLTRLFNTLNWTLTEFTVAVSDLHEQRGRRMVLEARQQFRRTGLMFELSVNLLRIMEFVAAKVPVTFVGGPAVNMSRLLELLPFVLSDFTTGPAARKLGELLGRSSTSTGGAAAAAPASAAGPGAAGPAAEPAAAPAFVATEPAAAAAAAVAAITAMAAAPPRAAPAAPAAAGAGAAGAPAAPTGTVTLIMPGQGAVVASPGPTPGTTSVQVVGGGTAGAAARLERNTLAERVSKPAILAPVVGIVLGLWEASSRGEDEQAGRDGGGGASSSGQQSVFVVKLADLADKRFMEHLKFVQDLDWCSALPNVPLSDQLRALRQFVEALQVARAAQEAREAEQSEESEVPDDFLDPITMTVMEDPVKLPDSQVTVDRSTIERHLLSGHGTDPFSRAPLTLEQVQPDTALQARMQAWRTTGKDPQRTSSGAVAEGGEVDMQVG